MVKFLHPLNDPLMSGIGMTSQRTRNRMVKRLQAMGISHPQVLEVMAKVPRHLFVDEALAHRAYEDTALPLGFGQTLSQPYTVARMTELVLAHQPRKVLEVGTGSGYQTYVLSCLIDQVLSIERLTPLHTRAQARLQALGLQQTHLRLGDGFAGWPQQAPFDAILVTAAPEYPPDALLKQLHPEGGVMLIPLGNEHQQSLYRLTRDQDQILHEEIEPVRFVPLLQGVVAS
ncbi:protein-L-isoaspartate(D-aspartate) O-methyltransferase [Allopseudospirillum japonicum]|uniref:Protein-L-isoaspartate O-methyltransferase n=1 Tax=Allopseudospirillum japonicum TaxID=64971 RepID=A0A1H6R102_9GAMM|nr:protein-L-isoaspartate(D-aspartate) O-methyltransferase [Allopseudospirillum japonicum]SEI48066.1 protein-L-isoaspartate(D-aspartate) O-methyltransferase [Allopseudospirillum japonicum]